MSTSTSTPTPMQIEEPTSLDMEVKSDPVITLITNDGFNHQTVKSLLVLYSGFLREMFEQDPETTTVSLPKVSNEMLTKIIGYMVSHGTNIPEEIEKPLSSSNLKDCGVDDFDVQLVNLNDEQMEQLLNAVHYMLIPSLIDLVSAKYASILKDLTPEQIRTRYNITRVVTPEEVEKIKKDNAWVYA
jgi:hypothetical protein